MSNDNMVSESEMNARHNYSSPDGRQGWAHLAAQIKAAIKAEEDSIKLYKDLSGEAEKMGFDGLRLSLSYLADSKYRALPYWRMTLENLERAARAGTRI